MPAAASRVLADDVFWFTLRHSLILVAMALGVWASDIHRKRAVRFSKSSTGK